MTTYLLGLDISTTGSTALLIDEHGEVHAEASHEHPLSTPHPLWSEQNPADWWDSTLKSIRQVLSYEWITPDKVAGIGLTGQMHGLVLLDAAGEVLRPCILWNDQRTGKQCAAVTEKVGLERILQLTGNPVLPGFTAPKVVWVRENEPDVYARAAKILLPKDYIRYKLTGGYFSEVSDSSGTAMFDVGKRRWSDEMLAALEIPRAWLPEVAESPVVTAHISREVANMTGLLEGTPVVGGGGDQAAQAVGTGIVSEGIISATLGTSGVVFAASDSYRVDPEGRLHAFCHAVPGKWHLMGVILAAAGSFQWYRNALGATEVAQAQATGRDVYDILTENAATVPPGSEGLLFLPYLSGERTPHPDPNARGVFFGLTLRHNKNHLTRAVMEGVSFAMLDSMSLMRRLGLESEQIRASGGGSRSALWRQILADAFETPIVTVNVSQGAAYGAALLAGVGAGVYPDVPTASQQVINITGETKPGPGAAVYADYYPRYQALYPTLKAEFEALAQVVEKHLT